jgi:predicted phage tail protein
VEQLRTIKLLGAAGRKFGREFRLAVKSPAEAFRALCVLCPGLKAWTLEQHNRGVAWRVITDDPTGLEVEELDRETSADIVFTPLVRGAGGGGGGGGFFSIILGVALIAASLIIPFGAVGGGLGLGLLGASLVLGGIAQLITPTPVLPTQAKTGENNSNELESNLFTRGASNGAQGEVVPVLYGRRRIPAPRLVSFTLAPLPATREVNTTGAQGLLGYVNREEL